MTDRPNLLRERFVADDLANARQAEFENIIERDRRTEWRLFWCELIALLLLVEFAVWALSLSLQGR
jgi:hypothetical protein